MANVNEKAVPLRLLKQINHLIEYAAGHPERQERIRLALQSIMDENTRTEEYAWSEDVQIDMNQTIRLEGYMLKRHPNGGGWVSSLACVSEDTYIGPHSRVIGESSVERSKIEGASSIFDSYVENSTIYGSEVKRSAVYDSLIHNASVHSSHFIQTKAFDKFWVRSKPLKVR